MADDDGASMDGGLSPLDPEAPAETPEDWKAFVDFQPNGRVLRSSPVMAGGDIDLWSPDGACEEMLIDQNAVQVRKRQDDGRCRVDGCERQAPKAPFLCEYHATGEFYTVAVMDVERGGSRCAGARDPGRPVPWEQGGSPSNATSRVCPVQVDKHQAVPTTAQALGVPQELHSQEEWEVQPHLSPVLREGQQLCAEEWHQAESRRRLQSRHKASP